MKTIRTKFHVYGITNVSHKERVIKTLILLALSLSVLSIASSLVLDYIAFSRLLMWLSGGFYLLGSIYGFYSRQAIVPTLKFLEINRNNIFVYLSNGLFLLLGLGSIISFWPN